MYKNIYIRKILFIKNIPFIKRNISFVKRENSILTIINKMVIEMPTTSSLNYVFNLGSLLGVCLMIQIISGFFLCCHYIPSTLQAFSSIELIMREVNYGWLIRYTHMNGASFMFLFLYLHIGKALYYGSYLKKAVYASGMLMFVLTMAIAFLGYVLPWGQMSYWGATVITNFFTVIPLWGFIIVEWLWGGFGVGQATLGRFFALHFLLPLVLLGLVGLHIFLLHIEGSISPLGIETIIGRIPFYIYYIIKDLVGVMWFFLAFAWIVFYEPLMFAESENFIRANPMVTPAHIVPEWYFLYAYAILRCIPKKGLGVIALVLSIVILAIMPLNHTSVIISKCWLPLSKLIFWLFISNFILNTLLGGAPVAYIYTIVAQTIGLSYFLFFISFFPTSGASENKIIFT